MVLNYSYKIPFFHYFIHSAIGSQDALEQYDFSHFLVDVGFLLYGLDHFLKVLLLAKLFDAAQGDMGHKVLTVAQEAYFVEGVEGVLSQVEQLFGCLLHAEPQHTRGIAATENSCAVEVHYKRMVTLQHLAHSLYDLRLVLRRRLAYELQGKVYVGRSHPVYAVLVREAFAQVGQQRLEAVVFGLNRNC